MVDGFGGVREASLRNRTDLLVVACGSESDGAVALVDESRRQYPDRPVIVLCTGSPNGFVRRVFAAGADDIGTLPLAPDQLRFMIDKAITRRIVPTGGDGAPAAEKRMIVVLGPKGGTGKTLTACNLAVKLAEHGQGTVLVDLDLQFGDVGLALGMRPEHTIYDLATAPGTMDADKIERIHDDPRLRTARAVGAGSARPGLGGHRRVPGRALPGTSGAPPVRDRRHAARLHAGGDRIDRRLQRHLPGRHAGHAVAQEHPAGPGDARPDALPAGAGGAGVEPRRQPGRHHPRRRSEQLSAASRT